MTSQLPRRLQHGASSSGAGAQQLRTTQRPKLSKIVTRKSLRAILRQGTLCIISSWPSSWSFWSNSNVADILDIYMLFSFWMDYGPPIHLCGMFSFPANPSVSKNIPPLFQSANGNPLDFLLGKRKDRSSNPWDAGAAAKSAMDMLDGLKALATITMKIHPTKLLFSSRSKMPIFFTVSILQFNKKCFKQKQKKDWSSRNALNRPSWFGLAELSSLRPAGLWWIALAWVSNCSLSKKGGRVRTHTGMWLNPR